MSPWWLPAIALAMRETAAEALSAVAKALARESGVASPAQPFTQTCSVMVTVTAAEVRVSDNSVAMAIAAMAKKRRMLMLSFMFVLLRRDCCVLLV